VTAFQSESGFLDAQGAALYYEVAGQGYPLLLIHAGIADSRMWDEQFPVFAQRYKVIRFDLRGYGQSAIPPNLFADYEDPALLLRSLGIEKAHVVGVSFGGKIAIDFTLAHPEMVSSLVLVAPDLGGYVASAEVQQFNEEEARLLEQGDLDAAAELNVRTWVDGPRRGLEQVNPRVRERVREMQYHAFTIPVPDGVDEIPLEPPAIKRLAEIRVPTLLIIGDYDLQEKHALVDLLAKQIPGTRRVTVANAAHMVNMEQPEEFNRLVLDFLAE
jgi:pimeloyl-ACP methyl ester carboxylesterase